MSSYMVTEARIYVSTETFERLTEAAPAYFSLNGKLRLTAGLLWGWCRDLFGPKVRAELGQTPVGTNVWIEIDPKLDPPREGWVTGTGTAEPALGVLVGESKSGETQ